MGAGRTRLNDGPWLAYACDTKRSSSSMRRFWLRSATVTALAMAERSAFSMSRAMAFLVKRRMESASAAFLPRISSSTSPAFWAELRMYLAVALTSSMPASLRLGGRRRGRPRGLGHLLHLGGVALERP